MNYCHRCQSSYTQPGTCNCFAPTQPTVAPEAPWYVPVPLPTTPYSPWVNPTYPPGTTTWCITGSMEHDSATGVFRDGTGAVVGSDNLLRS